MPRPQLHPRNDNIVYLRGLVDAADARNADGTPKYIDDATVTWEIRTEEYPDGSQVANGTATPVGEGGEYLCELADSIAILAETDYWIHVVVVGSGFNADFSDSFKALARTGRNPTT